MQEIFDAIRIGAHGEAAAAIAGYTSDINVRTGTWRGSVLAYAVLYDSIPVIEALAARGDLHLSTTKDDPACDPVFSAVSRPATLRAVLHCFPAVELDAWFSLFHNKTALGHAAFCGLMESVQLLLDAGANPALLAPHNLARQAGHEAIALLIQTHAAWVNGLRRVWTRATVDASGNE